MVIMMLKHPASPGQPCDEVNDDDDGDVIIVVMITMTMMMIIIIIIISGGSEPGMVLKPSGVFALLAIRPSFSTALDGGDCSRES